MQLISTILGLGRWLMCSTKSTPSRDGRRSTPLPLVLLVGLISISVLRTANAAVGEIATSQDAIELELQRAEDSKLVDGLRRRRLFDLAQLHCQRRLSQTSIDPTSEAHLTIELMKTQTAKAILSATTERATAWQSVDQTATQFSTATPDHPRRLLVEVQRALSHLTHAKMIRQEIAAEIATASAGEEALNEIRTARSLLERLGSDIDQAIPELRGRSKAQHDLTAEQLLNLKNNLRLQLATCNLIRSQLYEPTDRLNRVAALGEVKQQLGEVQRVTSKGQPLWWNTQLGQVECLRLLGDSGAAKLLVDSLPDQDVPSATVLPLLEQKVRLAIEMGNEAFSQQVFEAYLKLPTSNPQLDLALVELSADLSARATSDELKKQWLDYASGFARKIESDHGGYWGRRADLVLIRSAGGDSASITPGPNKTNNAAVKMDKTASASNTELDQLIRLGENAFRKNNLDDSIKAYRQAVAKSRSLNDPNQALQLGMIIGQILEKQSKPDIAADQFIKSALADTKATNASSAHLRGCWNMSQSMSAPTTGKTEQELSKRLTIYRAELNRHLELWPAQPSADHARLYLADRNRRDRQWQTAFENYLGVQAESPHFPLAVQGLGATSQQLLAQAKRNQQSTLNLSSDLILSLTKKRSEVTPDSTSSMLIEVLIAELEMLFGGGASDQTIADNIARRLEPIEKAQESSNLSDANSARAIRAAAICVNDPTAAKALVVQIGEDKNSLELCESCLEAIVSNRNPKQTAAANRLRLLVIESLLNTSSAPDQASTKQTGSSNSTANWMLKKSEVLSSLSRHAESVAVLEKLKTEFPRNAGIQMQLARSLTAQFRTSQPGKPLDHWRRLLRKLKSNTPNWFEAKYNVALLLNETGKTAETVKLLKLLRDVGAGWERSEFKSKFESLLDSAESSN